MVPFGIALAATVRVGQAAGRRDAQATRRAGFAAILLGAGFMTGMTLLVALARSSIPSLFLGAEAPEAAQTAALASTLLVVGASFFIADGTQTVAAGALRGLNDTSVPLLFAALSFWGVAFTSGLWLAFSLEFGAVGVWIGLSVGLILYAALLLWRFELLTRRRYLPPPPGA
jgi:MATE family multidrug resistance protein